MGIDVLTGSQKSCDQRPESSGCHEQIYGNFNADRLAYQRSVDVSLPR
jgi:hypothetical protein